MNTQAHSLPNNPSNPNWQNVSLFLGITFALTWGLNLLIWLAKDNLDQSAAMMLWLQLQMLIPAFCAIVLSLFVFKNNPLHRNNYLTTMQLETGQNNVEQISKRKIYGPRWFFYAYLLFTLIYTILATLSMIFPDQALTITSISGGFNILMLIVLIAIRVLSGGKAFARAGLKGGKPLQWIFYGMGFILFYGLSTALNAAFGLGQPSDPVTLLTEMSGGQSVDMPLNVLRLVLFMQTAIVGPLLGIVMGFGEEFGWRSYLQGELIKLGKVRGILILGIIWGIWHYPVIWMGHNYPGYPVWGSLMMTGYTILLGFVLGYAMLKTGSIWLVAFLHALNNQALAFFTIAFYQVDNTLLSFGIGIYGLLTMLPIVLLLLRDRIWQKHPEPEPVQA